MRLLEEMLEIFRAGDRPVFTPTALQLREASRLRASAVHHWERTRSIPRRRQSRDSSRYGTRPGRAFHSSELHDTPADASGAGQHKMTVTITDLFCGAGGSTAGAVQVPGVRVIMAANHWRLAVATHQVNHPSTDHDCVDVSQVDPRRYPATDVLWASPECTNHSQARGISRLQQVEARRADLLGTPGVRPGLDGDAAMRSRATMWDVVRFAERHRYRAIIVENVVEAASWVLFPAWRAALTDLGYEMRLVCLNSMHAHQRGMPAPQSRDRLYVVAWRRGERAPNLEQVVRPWAWCPEHGWVRAVQTFKRPDALAGRYRSQYVYRCRGQIVEPPVLPAASVIDWTDPGTRIGDRPRPLAKRTKDRIRIGIDRYWASGTVQSTRHPLPADGAPTPVISLLRASRCQVMTPVPFIVELRGGGSCVRPVTAPLATVTASGNHHGLATAPGSCSRAEERTRARSDCCPLLGAEDVSFRMLTPEEITAAMAFPASYVLLGTKREQVRQAGNAVTPPAARDIVTAIVEAVES